MGNVNWTSYMFHLVFLEHNKHLLEKNLADEFGIDSLLGKLMMNILQKVTTTDGTKYSLS